MGIGNFIQQAGANGGQMPGQNPMLSQLQSMMPAAGNSAQNPGMGSQAGAGGMPQALWGQAPGGQNNHLPPGGNPGSVGGLGSLLSGGGAMQQQPFIQHPMTGQMMPNPAHPMWQQGQNT